MLYIHSLTDASKAEIYKTLILYAIEGGEEGGKKDKLVQSQIWIHTSQALHHKATQQPLNRTLFLRKFNELF